MADKYEYTLFDEMTGRPIALAPPEPEPVLPPVSMPAPAPKLEALPVPVVPVSSRRYRPVQPELPPVLANYTEAAPFSGKNYYHRRFVMGARQKKELRDG